MYHVILTHYIGEDLDGRDTLIPEGHIGNCKIELILTFYTLNARFPALDVAFPCIIEGLVIQEGEGTSKVKKNWWNRSIFKRRCKYMCHTSRSEMTSMIWALWFSKTTLETGRHS